MAGKPFKFKPEDDEDIIKAVTSAFKSPSSGGNFSMKDLDEYLTRLGKSSPTLQDAIRFSELAMKVSTIFTKDLTFMFPVRKFYLEKDDAGIESLKNYYKLPDSQVAEMKALLNSFDARYIDEKLFKPLSDRIDTFNATQQQQQQQQQLQHQQQQQQQQPSSSSSSSSSSSTPFPITGESMLVMKPLYLHQKKCRLCFSGSTKLFKCSRCKSVFYCGVEHQKEDFGRHKKECKPLG